MFEMFAKSYAIIAESVVIIYIVLTKF